MERGFGYGLFGKCLLTEANAFCFRCKTKSQNIFSTPKMD